MLGPVGLVRVAIPVTVVTFELTRVKSSNTVTGILAPGLAILLTVVAFGPWSSPVSTVTGMAAILVAGGYLDPRLLVPSPKSPVTWMGRIAVAILEAVLFSGASLLGEENGG